MPEKLLAAEGVFRVLVEEARDFAIALIAADGTIVTWNRGAQLAFGYTPEEVKGKHFRMLFTDTDRATGVPERELNTAAETGRAEDTRWHVRRDGTLFFADGVTTSIRSDTGAVIGFAKITRDVTERFRAEQRIAAQLALTSVLSQEQPIAQTARRVMQSVCEGLGWDIGGLWKVDEDGSHIRCIDQWHATYIDSAGAEALFVGHAFSPGEGLPGKVWLSREAVWMPDLSDASVFARSPQAARAGMRTGFGFPILHSGAVTGTMEFFSSERREPDQALMPVMTLIGAQIGDYIDRRHTAERLKLALEHEQQARAQAEAAREQLERRAAEEAAFRHLASALTGAVEMTEVLHEITNRATQVTRADGVYVERIVGPSRAVEVVASAGRGAPPRNLHVAYPGSLTEEIMKEQEPVILADMSGVGRSIAPYLAETCSNCQILVTPLIADDEQLGALVLLNSGISGRKFGRGDIVRARTLGDLTSLALRRVRLMEQEREAKEKAEAAVRVRDETLGIVSHDLRNPLTKVALSAEMLAGASPDEQTDLVQTIRTASRQMQRLIDDLLDVARLESGRFAVEKRPLSTEELLSEVCASNQTLASPKQQRIICHRAGNLPEICADHDRLVQVFGNLIGNAIKFTPDGGTITIEARAEDGDVHFSVIDTGPGIPESDLGNVFRPYWQAKKTAHMGAGLGLAIVRGIVEAHGGKVSAGNGARCGAVFTFTIPVATMNDEQ